MELHRYNIERVKDSYSWFEMIVTIANQKVLKTTTVVNLATALASIDKKVLVLDMDLKQFINVIQCL